MTIQKITLLGIYLFTLYACKETHSEKKTKDIIVNEKASKKDTLKQQGKIDYYRFIPDSISDVKIKGFQIDNCYQLGNRKLITGYYEPVDGKIIPPDTENDYGHRLLFLKDNDIIFKSTGVGDTYLYEPYFFKNSKNGKTIVICQLAYEYFFGGNMFLINNDNIKYIGNIDVEGDDTENKMIDIVSISELENKLIVSFNAKSLILQPGTKDIRIKNKNLRYEYDGKIFKLIK